MLCQQMERSVELRELWLRYACCQAVSIATRNQDKNGGNIACTILYVIGALLGLTMAGSYSDLRIWGVYSGICGIMHLASMGHKNNPKSKKKK